MCAAKLYSCVLNLHTISWIQVRNFFSKTFENLRLQTIFFFYRTAMTLPPRSVALERAERGDNLSSSDGIVSDLVKTICQVKISDFREEVHAKLNSLHEEVTKLRSNTTMVIELLSVCLDSLESTTAPAVVPNEESQLRKEDRIILEGCNARSIEMDLWFFRVAEQSVLIELKNDTNPAHASGLKERCQAAQRSGYSYDTDSTLSKDSLSTEFEEELRSGCRATQHEPHF